MEEEKLTRYEPTKTEEVTTVPSDSTEEEDEDEGSAIGGLIALIGGGIVFGVSATAFGLKVKAKFDKKRDERRKMAEYDNLLAHCPDGFEVVMTETGAEYLKLKDEDKDEPAPAPTEEKKEEK